MSLTGTTTGIAAGTLLASLEVVLAPVELIEANEEDFREFDVLDAWLLVFFVELGAGDVEELTGGVESAGDVDVDVEDEKVELFVKREDGASLTGSKTLGDTLCTGSGDARIVECSRVSGSPAF